MVAFFYLQVVGCEAMSVRYLSIRPTSWLVRGLEANHRPVRSSWRAERVQSELRYTHTFYIFDAFCYGTLNLLNPELQKAVKQ